MVLCARAGGEGGRGTGAGEGTRRAGDRPGWGRDPGGMGQRGRGRGRGRGSLTGAHGSGVEALSRPSSPSLASLASLASIPSRFSRLCLSFSPWRDGAGCGTKLHPRSHHLSRLMYFVSGASFMGTSGWRVKFILKRSLSLFASLLVNGSRAHAGLYVVSPKPLQGLVLNNNLCCAPQFFFTICRRGTSKTRQLSRFNIGSRTQC